MPSLQEMLEKVVCFNSHPKNLEDIINNDVIKAYLEQQIIELIKQGKSDNTQ